nr:hypothetical protein [Tanacetum cinerariifolium]
FTCTFFLKTKDESSGILRKFITETENLKDLKVKIIRVLVNKSYNKTPYELFNGKFEAKGDEGYFIWYSMSSKAFRVFIKRTKRVKENLHVDFLENKAIEKGAGLNWLFDIDSLTKSMNYVPVVVVDILRVTTNSNESNGGEADVRNMETTVTASPTPTLRIHKDHPKSQIIGHVDTPIQTRNKSKEVREQSFIATIHRKTDPALLQFCLFSCFLSQVEPKKISD